MIPCILDKHIHPLLNVYAWTPNTINCAISPKTILEFITKLNPPVNTIPTSINLIVYTLQ